MYGLRKTFEGSKGPPHLHGAKTKWHQTVSSTLSACHVVHDIGQQLAAALFSTRSQHGGRCGGSGLGLSVQVSCRSDRQLVFLLRELIRDNCSPRGVWSITSRLPIRLTESFFAIFVQPSIHALLSCIVEQALGAQFRSFQGRGLRPQES